MKKLGLIGGMGPESTIPYYRDIVYGVQSKVGANFFPRLTIESVNVFEVLDLCRKEDYGQLTDYLLGAINNVIACGADFAALAANTPHIVFDALQKSSAIPLVSIVEASAAKAESEGFKRVGLLGTVFTMNGDFFKKPFIQRGIEVIVPFDDEKAYVDKKIAEELELGIIKTDTRSAFLHIIERMKNDQDIQAIILGCTELPLLFDNVIIPVKSLDTMKVHIEAIVEMILG